MMVAILGSTKNQEPSPFDEEKPMKSTRVAALASFLFISLTGLALAADPAAPAAQKPIVVSDKVTVKATVEAIDHTNRVVALKGPQGNIVELSVDDSVKRFDNLKIGDVVTASYYESVAYDIKKPGTPVGVDTITTQNGKYTGAKPGGGVTDTTVSTVTITAIDASIPAVTFRTSDGAIETRRVIHTQYLKDIKVGDVVVVTKKKALMISVE
jgi:ABC-type Fe3+-hydroxamate transport system substrate-binding protein